ncbi:serine/threonine-protein kinase [Nannocystis radixulma]|uniref:Protein kinase n=1 Tax=Nannocystis radixulma TaxID=2995305 RepID=A0ABT5BQG4_9BACT|nr:serine/threonine-protein kinase [Nannocystis radixulma]MDC0675963.1 protein kinase [Nannocystis radixulma]
MALAATSQQRIHLETADVTAHDQPGASGEFSAAPLPRPDLARDPEHQVHKAALASELFDQPPQVVQLAHYRIIRQLGHGSMGTVYLADDDRLGRQVALKLLHDEQHLPRLRREAHALARLSHPNVVQVFHVGSAGGRGFVAMEYVPGQTLHAWLRQSRRPWREVLAVFLAAGRGLAAVHAAGLVHRDFKPSNLVLGDDGRARVFDFGLARSIDADDDAPASSGLPDAALTNALTQTGILVGTPAYMALEQFRGEVCDARGDQFSFCVALFEALYGVRPYDGPTVADLHRALDRGQPVAPPIDAQVPAWLHTAVIRGLARDPADRWPSMTALLAELGRDRDGARRRRWLGAAIAGLGALALGLAAPYVQQHRLARACEATTDAELAEIRPPAARAHDTSAAHPFTPNPDRVAQHLENDARRWRDERVTACVAPPPRIADSTWLKSQMQHCFDDARDDLRINFTAADEAAPPVRLHHVFAAEDPARCLDPAHLLAARYPESDDQRQQRQAARVGLLHAELAAGIGDLAAAESRLATVLAAPQDPALALAAHEALARVRFAAGRRRAAWDAIDAAFTAAIAAAPAKLPDQTSAALDLQIVLGAATGVARQAQLSLIDGHEISPALPLPELVRRSVNDDDGVPFWRQPLVGLTTQIADRLLPRLAVAAEAWADLGEFDAAEDAARRGLAIAAVHPERSVLIVDLLLVLGRAYVGMGLLDRGEETLLRARRIVEPSADSAVLARRGRLQLALVELRLARGDREGAARELAVAEDMSQESSALDDRHAPALALARGRLLALRGDLAGATHHLGLARDGLADSHGIARLRRVDAGVELARLALAEGRFADAEAGLREALRNSEALVGAAHVSQLPIVALLGRSQHALGDLEAARTSLARARDLLAARVAAAEARAAQPDPLAHTLGAMKPAPDLAFAFLPVPPAPDARDPELRELAALLGEVPR